MQGQFPFFTVCLTRRLAQPPSFQIMSIKNDQVILRQTYDQRHASHNGLLHICAIYFICCTIKCKVAWLPCPCFRCRHPVAPPLEEEYPLSPFQLWLHNACGDSRIQLISGRCPKQRCKILLPRSQGRKGGGGHLLQDVRPKNSLSHTTTSPGCDHAR